MSRQSLLQSVKADVRFLVLYRLVLFELTEKSRIQLAASQCRGSICWTYLGQSKQSVQVQLSLLLVDERLFILSRPSVPAVNSIPDSFAYLWLNTPSFT